MNPYAQTAEPQSKIHSLITSKIFLSLTQVLIDILLYQIALLPLASNAAVPARIFLTGTMTACMVFTKLYGFRNLTMLEEIEHVLKSSALMLLVDALYLYAAKPSLTFWGILLAAVIFVPLTLVVRFRLRSSLFRRGILVKTVLVIGTGSSGRIFVHNVNSSPFTLKKAVGFLDDDPSKHGTDIAGVRVLGGIGEFERIQEEICADEVVISDSSVPAEMTAGLAEKYGVDVYSLEEPEEVPSREMMKPVNIFAKTIIDYTGALVALVIFSPIMLWAAYRIKKEDGGSIFFIHPRFGRELAPFGVYKFRTMRPDAADILSELLKNDEKLRAEFAHDFKLKHDPRITKIGHILRNWSLDELPQLFNVLRGEMSLVGPRPVVDEEVKNYYGYVLSKRVFSMKPGMTGLWQVSGRNDVDDYGTRINYDIDYVNNWSVWLDLAILLKTPLIVLSKKGAY